MVGGQNFVCTGLGPAVIQLAPVISCPTDVPRHCGYFGPPAASLVVLCPGEKCVNATSGLFRLLGRAVCDDSAEWMLHPCGVKPGEQFDIFLPRLLLDQ